MWILSSGKKAVLTGLNFWWKFLHITSHKYHQCPLHRPRHAQFSNQSILHWNKHDLYEIWFYVWPLGHGSYYPRQPYLSGKPLINHGWNINLNHSLDLKSSHFLTQINSTHHPIRTYTSMVLTHIHSKQLIHQRSDYFVWSH